MRRVVVSSLLGASLIAPRTASAQGSSPSAPAMFVNDEWDHYWRMLQLTGDAPLYPWSIRPFSTDALRRLAPTTTAHPWASQLPDSARRLGLLRFQSLPVESQATVNTGFPFGYNAGPVWAGRGFTGAISGGLQATAGPVTLTIDPLYFWAQNSSFALAPNGQVGAQAFGQAFLPMEIDQPQRFGNAPYHRLDPGNSSLRIEKGFAVVGFGTENQQWGPAHDNPIVLGNNASGFPNVFIESAHPIDLPLIRVHGRIEWGRLADTPYSVVDSVHRFRLATGLVGLIEFKSIPGLEIGGDRFINAYWQPGVLDKAHLWGSLFHLAQDQGSTITTQTDNQIASVFFRWVFPNSGFESYGELGRRDHAIDLRDFTLEPDHDIAYLLGFARAWRHSPSVRFVIRGELLNTRINGLQLVRAQDPFYSQPAVLQGLTNMGQVLGSIGGFGGGASELAFDRYSPAGRWSITAARIMNAEYRLPSGLADPSRADVSQTLGVSGVRFRGGRSDGISYDLTGVYELNRNFGRDAFDLRAQLGYRYEW